MAKITLQGNEIETIGFLPEIGTVAPDFTLVKTDLSEINLGDLKGKTIVLNIFPSIDTPVCATSVRKFNQAASLLTNTVVLCVSADLPFAHGRFCEIENINNVIPVSSFRNSEFGEKYGNKIITGPLSGLLARSIVIIDTDGKIIYNQQVPEIKQEPDYEQALNKLPK